MYPLAPVGLFGLYLPTMLKTNRQRVTENPRHALPLCYRYYLPLCVFRLGATNFKITTKVYLATNAVHALLEGVFPAH